MTPRALTAQLGFHFWDRGLTILGAEALAHLGWLTRRRRAAKLERLLQFCVLGSGFEEQRDTRVGVFPGGEKVLISDASLGNISLLLK